MSARDDYPAIGVHARWPNDEGKQCEEALGEIDNLRRWKSEAETVLEAWDIMWEEVGCPGKLGQTKSKNILELIRQLQDHKAQLREELAKHGWGDFHYSSNLEQDPEIVRLLEETK